MPKYYPVMLDIRDRQAIVIGGDALAASKATALFRSGAHVTAISPTFGEEFRAQAARHEVTLLTKVYEPGDLAGAFVVVAATSDPQLIEQIWQETQERGQLVNIVDVPARCNFILPSILRRGQLTIAVSTEGASPGLAKRIRQQLEDTFPPAYDRYMQLATVARTLLREQETITYEQRDRFFGDFFEESSEILHLLSVDNEEEALTITVRLLERYGVATTTSTLATRLAERGLQ